MRSDELILLHKLYAINGGFVLLVAAMASIGFAMLYSVAGENLAPWAKPQMVRFAVGMTLVFVIVLVDIRIWMRMAWLFYALGVAFLIAVEVKGFIGMGAQRWITIGGFAFQPSEMMKVCLTLALARYYQHVHFSSIERPAVIGVALLIILLPAAIVLRQPNLGTASILILSGAAMMFLAGVSWKKFVLAGALGLMLLPFAWQHLHDYQKQRVMTFINPEADPLGAGYNILQSKIAIGSGGLMGKGFTEGTQSQLDFLPEKQTDFIFTAVCEEFGFLGGLTVLALYAAMLLYGAKVAVRAQSTFAKLIAGGITSLLFIHVFINVGMVSGILPVVGVPLPLLSYGGSSLLSTLIGFGFLLNADVHRGVKIN